MKLLTITRPDDWHLHLRDGAAIKAVVPHTAERFGRAIIMPNLTPPVTDLKQALAYRLRILAALPPDSGFQPLMTLYLTDNTLPAEVVRARESGYVHGIKLYPAGATTNSEAGVTDIRHVYKVLDVMHEIGMPLLVHGEVTDPDVDVFDRERVFIELVLAPLIERFPRLRVVFEHVTTREGVEFVKAAPSTVAATITAHHLWINRNAMFVGGVRPHHYCLPVAKREGHRQALVAAATSGDPKFFLGTDSAPHPRGRKETACGCAGIYTAYSALELYAEAFEQSDALDRLEAFASHHGPDFYGLPRSRESITLKREAWSIPDSLPFGGEVLVPFRAGETIKWRIGG
ncbi:MAG: dihydroorotase [Gammaproteobacteria bacterium]|nr:dihydroorotase [Gammaproteobacteria bacterium]